MSINSERLWHVQHAILQKMINCATEAAWNLCHRAYNIKKPAKENEEGARRYTATAFKSHLPTHIQNGMEKQKIGENFAKDPDSRSSAENNSVSMKNAKKS